MDILKILCFDKFGQIQKIHLIINLIINQNNQLAIKEIY